MKKNESEKEKKPHNRIAELRKDRGLTIQQVADGIGVSNGTISRYEKGTREPKLETWIKLAFYFDVPVAYLQGVSDNDDTHGYSIGVYDDNISAFMRFDKIFPNGEYKVSDGEKLDLVMTVDRFKDLLERNIPKKDDDPQTIKKKENLIATIDSLVNSLYAILIVIDKDTETKNTAINETKELAKSLIKLWHGPDPFK